MEWKSTNTGKCHKNSECAQRRPIDNKQEEEADGQQGETMSTVDGFLRKVQQEE